MMCVKIPSASTDNLNLLLSSSNRIRTATQIEFGNFVILRYTYIPFDHIFDFPIFYKYFVSIFDLRNSTETCNL